MVEVSREQFAQGILEYFKIVNQGYPERMEEILRKDWQGEFDDIVKAGFVIIEKEQDGPICVFYDEVKCPVRKEIKSVGFDKYVQPFEKGDDEAKMAAKIGGAVKQMFSGEWMILSGFCHMCSYKYWKDQEMALQKQESMAKKLHENAQALGRVRGELQHLKCVVSPTGIHQQNPSNPGYCMFCGEAMVAGPT